MSDSDFVIPFERLPERFAESIEHPPAEPATPRPAATIVLLRESSGGTEVLLMRRNRNAGFVPGAYVFPGGRVDGSDATPPVLDLVEGLSEGDAASRLELPDADPPAIAY
jgi:8-oxo-dGTP pyrophosphatase MutT (NUDIX family)